MKEIILVLGLVGILATSQAVAIEPYGTLKGPVNVLSVINGNTIKLDINGTSEKVRLIGIEAPETVNSTEASNYIKTLLTGQQVWVELDAKERDVHQRLLAYVYIEDSNGWWEHDQENFSQVNHLISANGWADTLTTPPNVRYESIYTQSVQAAREAKSGMWADVELDMEPRATIILLPPSPQ